MPLKNLKLSFRPGINRESTDYGNTGSWFDCDKVRFRDGYPEKIGGWVRFTVEAVIGTGRSLFGWSTLSSAVYYGVGTNLKYYQLAGGLPYDITPLRRTVTLGADPFTTGASGSSTITVTDIANGAVAGDFVTFSGATGFDGILAADLNGEQEIVEIIDSDTYTFTVSSTAVAGGVSGGGAVVEAEYQVNTGLDRTVLGDGWGTGTWGDGGWGEPSEDLTDSDRLRIWYQDNFGEDLLFNVRDAGIYIKKGVQDPATRGTLLSDEIGAVDVPTTCRQVLVSDVDRHVLAFGCNGAFSSIRDPLLIRWSDQESAVNWDVADTTTTAGSLRIDRGSEILRAIETQNETLVFTDTSLHSIRYVGPPFTFGQTRLGVNISLISPNAVATNGSQAYWMGQGVFYVYDGLIQQLDCEIEDFVFSRINNSQLEKICTGLNRREGEVTWFIPTTTSENDFYVTYNYKYKIWYYGTLGRTAWIDSRFETTPLAVSPDGFVYQHEIGADDGSTMPVTPISAYIESSDFEIGDGDQFIYMRRHIPDVTFRNSSNAMPAITVTLSARNYPGAAPYNSVSADVTQTATVPVTQSTQKNDIRLRGRSFQYRIDSSDVGVEWRIGSPRIEIGTDGRR